MSELEVLGEKPASSPPPSAEKGEVSELGKDEDANVLELLGYKPELQKNRSMITLLFQSLAIAAIPCRLRYTLPQLVNKSHQAM
jgi:hypothetical protein